MADLIGLGLIVDFGWDGWERIEKYGWLCRWERCQNWPVDKQIDTYDWMRDVHISYSDLIYVMSLCR